MGNPSKADRVRETLDRIVDRFQSGDVPELIGKATFPPADIPLARWSLHNRVLAMMAGTADARGFRQWKEVGRHVKKGSRAFCILGPRMVKVADKETDEETMRLVGFVAIPVFRAEDTEGDPLDYQSHPVPAHPLMEVARRWDVKIETAGFQGHAYGWTDGQKITLCTPDELTFFHELGHVADGREHTLKGGQHSDQEIVAQLVAATLGHLVGRKDPNDGYSLKYISGYAQSWYPKLSPADGLRKACQRVLSRACKAIEKILAEADKETEMAVGAA